MVRFRSFNLRHLRVSVPEKAPDPWFLHSKIFSSLTQKSLPSKRGIIMFEVPHKGRIRVLFFKSKRTKALQAENVITGELVEVKQSDDPLHEAKKAIEFQKRTGIKTEKPVAIIESRGLSGTFFEGMGITPLSNFFFKKVPDRTRLKMASDLAKTIGKVHSNFVLFKDAHLGNLVVHNKTGEIGVIDLEFVELKPLGSSPGTQFTDAVSDFAHLAASAKYSGLVKTERELASFVETYLKSIKKLMSKYLIETGKKERITKKTYQTLIPPLMEQIEEARQGFVNWAKRKR